MAHRTTFSGSTAALSAELDAVGDRTRAWLRRRRAADGTGFGFAESSPLPVELNATTGGVELWIMLGMPLSDEERIRWIRHLSGYQIERTGLVADPTWRGRQIRGDAAQIDDGDSFFTMTTAAAIGSLGGRLPHPVVYPAAIPPAAMTDRIDWEWIAHSPWGIGDLAPLVRHNMQRGVVGAREQWEHIDRLLGDLQDPSGFWPNGRIGGPLTPHINRAFHVLRATWNPADHAIAHAAELIDACLLAAEDETAYGWGSGFACNDLDLAHVAYSAAAWSDHRRDDLAYWARRALPQLFAVEKSGGGFSFHHESAMETHAGISMSPGAAEGDMWGTLMYLGAIKMTVALGWPGTDAPWAFSQVHAVPRGVRG